MRISSRIVLVALAIVSLGCGKENTLRTGSRLEDLIVRINASSVTELVGTNGRMRAATSTDEAGQAYSGKTLGLFIDYGTGDKYSYENVRWDNVNGGWTPESQMLWKDAETPAKIYAYAPYVDEIVNPTSDVPLAMTFVIPSDQSGGTERADLVWFGDQSFTPESGLNQNGEVDIRFQHKLMKLAAKISLGDQFDGTGIKIKEVWLHETYGQVTFDLIKGYPSVGIHFPDVDIRMHDAGENCFEAVFVRGNGMAMGHKMLTIIMTDGSEYSYMTDQRIGVSYGQVLRLDLRVGKDKVMAGAVTVEDWTDGGTTTGLETRPSDYTVWDGRTSASLSGSGTEDDPYIVASGNDLAYVAEQVNANQWNSFSDKHFKLTTNIDLNGVDWTPIGHYEANAHFYFKGIFDGNGMTIRGLKVNGTGTENYGGLFGYVADCQIKNLTIQDADVITDQSAGILIGEIGRRNQKSSIISNCHVSGTVSVSESADGINGNYGGLIGYAQYAEVSNCTANVVLNGLENAGIIAGRAYESGFVNCSATGTVKAEYAAAVFVGRCNGCSFVDCTAEGKVDAGRAAAGFASWAHSTQLHSSYFRNCTADVEVITHGQGGAGFVNVASGIVDVEHNLYNYVILENCSSYGTVHSYYNGDGTFNYNHSAGGFIGEIRESTVIDCFSGCEVIIEHPANDSENPDWTGAFIGRSYSYTNTIRCSYDASRNTQNLRAIGFIPQGSEGTQSHDIKAR